MVNYTEREIPYTRIIEHKHFEFGTQDKTVITREYPADWKPGDEPYYPINDAKNEALYSQYEELAAQEGNVIFAGRLGGYKYYDMDKAIAAAFDLVRKRARAWSRRRRRDKGALASHHKQTECPVQRERCTGHLSVTMKARHSPN